MPRIEYRRLRYSDDHRDVIDKSNVILAELARRGYTLTLRQLYYQLVSRNDIENTEKSYKRLVDIITRARIGGLMDWHYLEDRTRSLRGNTHFEDPTSVMSAAAHSMRVDKWNNQPRRVEVWVEKEALAGIVGGASSRRDVDYFACRGYVSASEEWQAAQRHGAYLRGGQGVTILYLGDHDPSGIHMAEDNRDRLNEFLAVDYLRANRSAGLGDVTNYDADKVLAAMAADYGIRDGLPALDFRRVALNMDQIRQYGPPPNPAKTTDSRSASYIRQFGNDSWELDALDPDVLSALIDAEVDTIVDADLYAGRQAEEDRHRRLVAEASDRWDEVVAFLERTEAEDY